MSQPEKWVAWVQDLARCAACDAAPESVTVEHDPVCDEFIVRARCHGSRATFRVDAMGVVFGKSTGIERLGDWAAALFKEDASPDMRELLRYNREPSWLAS